MSCKDNKSYSIQVFETSAAGNQLTELNTFDNADNPEIITIIPTDTFQTITGFGGSFTEASAYLLNQLSPENRKKIIDAYFGDEGARYSLTRTHINSCDFSLSQYAYSEDPNDMQLEKFDISPDKNDIIPFIQDAIKTSSDGFKIIASPWTAPPYMKDNNHWVGGKLLPKYRDTWALYFAKYIQAFQKEGIDIWGVTVENEPLGNGNNWESMHYSPEEMTDFIKDHLGPKLEAEGLEGVKILGYDQNRDELKEWVDVMYANAETSKYIDGTAIHWYASTYEVFPDVLQYAHQKSPNKYLIETEGCIDAEVPVWQDDVWYWKKEATDWGWDWASAETKYLHPKYSPAFRYARDIIGCLNNWVDGWVDWNMVLDKQGGPNWFKNWCIAPVIVDPEKDEVYFTPLYYVMAHFSKYIRPGAKRIGWESNNKDLQITAAQNPDGSIAVVILNEDKNEKTYTLQIENLIKPITISGKSVQTIILNQTLKK
jgi:glucosylceramidase